jgi:alcohol dehydrogenase class IV
MSLPTFLEFSMRGGLIMGAWSTSKTGECLRSFGGSKILLCTDKGIANSGLLDQVTASLENAGIEYVLFDGVVANPRIETVSEGLDVYRGNGCDSILGVGGGSPIDTAKVIGVLATNEGGVTDYEGPGLVKNALPPLAAIPTTYGTGAEVSPAAIITHEMKKYKMILADPKMTPRVAILDPLLLLNLPPKIAASTGMDALTHAIESYVANSAEPFSDALNIQAIRLISDNLPAAMATNWDLEATANMLYASTMTGVAFANTALGFVHCMAHALGGMFDMPHGLANAVLLPYVMEYNLLACPRKFAEIARAMGENVEGLPLLDAAAKSIEAVRKLSKRLGIPQSLSEIGVDPESIDYMADWALKDGNTGYNPRSGTKEDFVALFRGAM